MESDSDETSKAYKANKSKVLEKLRKSITSKQTENEKSAMNAAVEKMLKDDVEDSDEAAELINKMDNMIKINKKNILTIAYKQGDIFRNLKTSNEFISPVSAFKINKATINFRIGIVDFIDKYPRMEKSCISLYYLKNNFKIIKEVSQESASKFQIFNKPIHLAKPFVRECKLN